MSNLSTLEILLYMQKHGSSVMLDWGEDYGLWECSWITGGKCYTSHSKDAFRALTMTLGQVGITDEMVLRHIAP